MQAPKACTSAPATRCPSCRPVGNWRIVPLSARRAPGGPTKGPLSNKSGLSSGAAHSAPQYSAVKRPRLHLATPFTNRAASDLRYRWPLSVREHASPGNDGRRAVGAFFVNASDECDRDPSAGPARRICLSGRTARTSPPETAPKWIHRALLPGQTCLHNRNGCPYVVDRRHLLCKMVPRARHGNIQT